MKNLPLEKKAKHARNDFHPSVFEPNLPAHHPHPHFDRATISWIAPEFLQHPKSTRWWVTAAIVVLVSMVLEALSGNWTMLAATLAFAFTYYLSHEYHPPRHTKINISDLGVKIGHRKIHYSEIEYFWIIYNPPEVKRLFIRLKGSLLPDLVFELEDQDPHAVREVLEKHLVEVTGVREHYTESLLRLFKL